MTDFSAYTRIVVLMSRSVSGIATESELDELSDWRKADPANEALFQEMREGEFWKTRLAGLKRPDVTGGYAKVMGKRSRSLFRRIGYRGVAAAASLVLSLGVAVYFWAQRQALPGGRPGIVMAVEEDSIAPGQVKAELLLADGSTVRLDGLEQGPFFEQDGSRIVAGSCGLNYADREPASQLVYHVLKIPRGGEYTLTLGDGTVIFLNSETELRYPVQFATGERRVNLVGEAYFEVAHDADRPFIVETRHSQVEVLGTSFNLRSYTDEQQVAATLVEGKVSIVTDRQVKVCLKPGEQAVWDEEGRLAKKEVDTYLYTAWKDGHFVFYRQSLEEVMRVISRWYDVTVHFIDDAQRKVRFTGNVKRYDDFSKIVDMLEMTGNTEFLINGKNIFIKGK